MRNDGLFPTFLFLTSQLSNVLASPSCADTTSLAPLLRAFLSGTSADHFYTTDSVEMTNAIANNGYSSEGEAAFIWATQATSTVPLYRLFSQSANDHFYTMSSDEVSSAESSGYAFDSAPNHIAGYVYPYSICGSSPIYRLYSSSASDHFYTMSYDESMKAQGYVVEGIAGYALLPSTDGQQATSGTPFVLPASATIASQSQGSSSTTCASAGSAAPFLRAYSSIGSNHFYTTDSTEMSSAIAQDAYISEGIAGFIWGSQAPSTVPLYRLYNQNVTDHFYTMSSDEIPHMQSVGYAFDSAPNHIAGYVYPYSICGSSPIYRLYSAAGTDHFYTMSYDEAAGAIGYVIEGIAGFALLPSVNGSPGTATSGSPSFFLPVAVTPSPTTVPTTTGLSPNIVTSTGDRFNPTFGSPVPQATLGQSNSNGAVTHKSGSRIQTCGLALGFVVAWFSVA